jgi:hypothetical protein
VPFQWLASAGKKFPPPRLNPSGGFMDDMDNRDDIGVAFDSPQAIVAMRKRHLRAALDMQQLAMQGLVELRRRGELTAEEYAELLDAGMKLERVAAPGGSRKRH